MGIDYFNLPDKGSETDLEFALRAIGGATWLLESRRQFFIEDAVIFRSFHDYQVIFGLDDLTARHRLGGMMGP